MRLLNSITDIESFRKAVHQCKDDVILRSADGREEFNLKSTLSEYIAIGELAKDHGDQWEVYCMNKDDERYMLDFFGGLNR